MILNEREMQIARELAKEFVRVEKVEEDEAWESACDMLIALKDVVTQTWDAIKEVIQMVYDEITKLHNEQEHPALQNWRLPINIEMPKMPDLQLNRMMNIRNHI